MSSEDEFTWGESDDEQRDGIIGTVSRRSSSRGGKAPSYFESDSDGSANDSNEKQIVQPRLKASAQKKKAKKSVLESLSDDESENNDSNEHMKVAQHETSDLKPPPAAKSLSIKSTATAAQTNEGVDIQIPHSLLNKHQGAGKGECTMLVQVQGGEDHPLDFHGQSGAVGRFEADGKGVTLDLKGFQYRGTIRPGPTAMVIALTRDNTFKVEAITDEFVTLDTERTNIMDKFDAIVEGEMDEGYKVTDDNVNRNEKKNRKQGEVEEGGGDKGTKRKSGKSEQAGGAVKKRKISVASKK